MKGYRIPFTRPASAGQELRYAAESIEAGYLAGDGPFTRRCSELLERELHVRKALLTTSCTHALEMCALLLELEPGDEVIVPSFAFVTTAGAFAMRGAVPVFVDVRSDTLNLDETRIRERVTERTRAIVALHYGGVACEMDAIDEIASGAGLIVVEDNAHGPFGAYRDRPLGTLGALATLSFHETKNFTCGEGGALLINDPRFTSKAEIVREKGTDRSRFFRGEVDRYTWIDLGSSYLPSEILAAFLYAQLEIRDRIQSGRCRVWNRYLQGLTDWAEAAGVGLPHVPEHCDQAYHLFYLLLPSEGARQGLIDHLKARGILAVFHYQPLHLSAMGRRFGGAPGDCPVTEGVSDRILRLPFYPDLSEAEQDEVIGAVLAFDGL
ncbi:MAG: dTDP-4-amino-4,6-dideoxygalactose transaminase [Proteobacteria bacterium]|nr:dTDP-4-amino-4,6-dideoxygalactose transaminase [Pseudomonadota bacterium]